MGSGVNRKDKQGISPLAFRNDLNKTTAFRKKRKGKKAFVMRFTEQMFQAVLLSQLLLAKEIEGTKLCGENTASSGFTGHWLQSRHWTELQPGGHTVPARKGTWPRSGSATSVSCDLGPHYYLSALSFCQCI